jgi:hypothetical protein
MNPVYLSSALEGATIPTELIIQLPHAWAIVTMLLALCCAILWSLTRGVMSPSPKDDSHDAARPEHGFGTRRAPKASRPRQPALQPLAHHGSRAA